MIRTDSELAVELGQRIRGRRIAKRMTQKTLAARAGVHVNTLRALERTGEVKLSSFLAVLRALGERSGMDALMQEPPPPDLYAPPPGRLPQRVRERRS